MASVVATMSSASPVATQPVASTSPAPEGSKPSSPPPESGEAKDIAQRSKYYYFGSTPQEQAKQYAPKPIVEDKPAPVAVAAQQGFSAWNHGGTWEEKDLSKVAHERVATALADLEVAGFADGRLLCDSCYACFDRVW